LLDLYPDLALRDPNGLHLVVIDAFMEDNLVNSVNLIGVGIEVDFGARSDFDSAPLKHKQCADSVSSVARQQFVKR